MDSESLDNCIQSTLSALYPPFQATAATVLCQVFDVVEKTYRGDGLRYLIDFLIPAKHILQCIQQDTCLQYCGRLFLHEGWPLCMHEKIVVQLASVDWRLLQPADFYLQVVPYLRKTPRIVLKCLSNDNHNIEEVVIPEVSYTYIFTLEWLDSINGDRSGTSLANCLLVSEDQLLRVPWSTVVNPEFIEKTEMVENLASVNNTTSEMSSTFCYTTGYIGSPVLCEENVCSGENESASHSALPCSEPSVNGISVYSGPSANPDSDSEGDYVELTNVSMPRFRPQMGSLTQSIALNYKPQHFAKEMQQSQEKHKPIVIRESTTSSKSLVSSVVLPNANQVQVRNFDSESPKNVCSSEIQCNNVHLLGSSPQSEDPKCRKISDPNLETPQSIEATQTGHSGRSQTTELSWTGDIGHEAAVEAPQTGNICFSTTETAQTIDVDNSAEAIRTDVSHSIAVGAMQTGKISDVSTENIGMGDSNSLLTHETSETEGAQTGDLCHSLIMEDTCDNLSLTTEGSVQSENSSHFRDVQELTGPVMDCSLLATECSETRCRLLADNSASNYSQTQCKLSAESSELVCQMPNESILGHTSNKLTDQVTEWKCSECTESTGRDQDTLLGVNLSVKPREPLPSDTPSQAELGSTESSEKQDPGQVEKMSMETENHKLLGHKKLSDGASETVGHPQRIIQYSSRTDRQDVVACTEEKGDSERRFKNMAGSRLAAGERPSADVSATLAEIFTVKANNDCQNRGESTETSSNDSMVTERNETMQLLQICREEQAVRCGMESEVSEGKAVEETLLSAGKDTPGRSKGSVSKVDSISFLYQSTDRGAKGQKAQVTEKAIKEQKILHADRDISINSYGVKLEKDLATEVPLPKVRSLHTFPTCAKDVNTEVLSSGFICLPGTRDKNGRAVVIVSTRNTTWLNPHCNTKELVHLFLYFYSTLRQECQALGLTILVDARRCSPVSALFKAVNILQGTVPNCIHRVLLLVERDLTFRVEKPTAMQLDLLSSKSLHRHIDSAWLPREFDGSFPYCHRDWLNFRMKLEHLQQNCERASTFLQHAIENLKSNKLLHRAEEARSLLVSYTQLMKNVLEDVQLVRLQLEGGAILARLKKEESCVTLTEDYRDAMERVTAMYNKVDEEVHQLVMLSNKRTQELELMIEFQAIEDDMCEVSEWIENVGKKQLQKLSELEDSLEVLHRAEKEFTALETVACEYLKRGQEVMSRMDRWKDFTSAEVFTYVVKLQTYRNQLQGFARRLDESRKRVEKTLILYQFFDQAYEWALERMRHLACISMEDCSSPEHCAMAIESLEAHKEQHPEISQTTFQEMKELASELGNSRGTKQWKFAWSKCQETKLVFEKKLEVALRARRLAGDGEHGSAHSDGSLIIQRRHSDGVDQSTLSEKSNSASYLRRPNCSLGAQGPVSPSGTGIISRELASGVSPSMRPSMDAGPGSLAAQKLLPRSVSDEELSQVSSILDMVQPQPSFSSTPILGRQQQRRMLKKARSLDLPCCDGVQYGCHRALSEPARRGNTGVFIKGLEVSSTELADRAYAPQHMGAHVWSADSPSEPRRSSSISSMDAQTRGSKLRHILEEMVVTEREYVRSLCYIIHNYYPEMDRLDLPQDLRGKRSVIFGNLEKLYDFHSQYFLKELESCCNHPLRVSHCFLRHKDQFGMYALYSKNKPKSDSLLSSHGNTFFKFKQMQLGDKMDLASYLLKPIQRMSKYALLLKDLIKECSEVQEQELSSLRAAGEMVKFQLRHGNDLLAMDTIRDCDVNLKEQGQLVRQDEFTVWLGRKKCQRHVFLFEDLILFSKPKKVEGGFDVFIYKRSLKTADIGLTENSGDSGLRFEIWFRRRKSNDTYVLQASTSENKQMWTTDIAKILWQQATRNKEIRMQEMVSMGVGNKPFLDIKPSDAAINDRAIDYIMKGRGARTRASIAVSVFDHSTPYQRTQMPHSSSNSVSCPTSSTSLLGPLNLHMYGSQALLPGLLTATRPFHISTCIEEDEQEQETSSQPSLTTESSESSQGVSGNGSSGSDSGCVSHIPRNSFSEGSASYGPSLGDGSLEENAKLINRQYISAV
ncbi:LOW QUALITY PROTEIN: puratrophin-1 [Rhinatrema bivittatum]|uniref:LOW QUALITY PROTEIN: puratrophin-1 n=1 Tax=Rhinatrema bivittatum TaxID=194408 RepID=UPI00112C5D7A|nr:LOW QUALITY PROTEIN: puratrophin-1 [Rhinatrema bivittatum]